LYSLIFLTSIILNIYTEIVVLGIVRIVFNRLKKVKICVLHLVKMLF